MEDLISSSRTCQTKMIFHNTVNDQDTLFGGIALQWMDEVAYITATRYTRMSMTTVSLESVVFKKPITPGSIVEIIGEVIKAGNVKIDIKVEIRVEEIDREGKVTAVQAMFTFAAIDKNHHPVRIYH